MPRPRAARTASLRSNGYTIGQANVAERLLKQCAFEDAAVRAQHELPFLSTFDDERLAAALAGGGLFATQHALRRHASNGGLVAVRTLDIPAHTGSNPQRLIGVLAARNDQVVAALSTLSDDAPRASAIGRHANFERL